MPTADIDSVLNSTKKILGIAAEYTYFDLDITIHINSVLSTLNQLGVGLSDEQGLVTSATDSWASILGVQKNLNMIKSYMYLRVRLLFDPPASGFGLNSMASQVKEFEYRIMIAASTSPNTPVISSMKAIWDLSGTGIFPAEAPLGAVGIDFVTGVVYRNV